MRSLRALAPSTSLPQLVAVILLGLGGCDVGNSVWRVTTSTPQAALSR